MEPPRRTWYQDKETGQTYSLDPPDERPGWWAELDPKDLLEPGEKLQRTRIAPILNE
jgi:hypothetical protein